MVLLRSALLFAHLRGQYVLCSSQVADYLFPLEQPTYDNLVSRGKHQEAAAILETARARFRGAREFYVNGTAERTCKDLGIALSVAHGVGVVVGAEMVEADAAMRELRREHGDEAMKSCLHGTKDPMDPSGVRSLDAFLDSLAPPQASANVQP